MSIRTDGRAFTLIEMLMVIIIIFMLSFIMFRMMGVVDNRVSQGETTAAMRALQGALSEYKLEYGIYPPVTETAYDYESPTNQTAWFRNVFLPSHNNPAITNASSPDCFFTDAEIRAANPDSYGKEGYTGHPRYFMGYKYGLAAHLLPREGGPHWYNEDTQQDSEAKARWASLLLVGQSGDVGGAASGGFVKDCLGDDYDISDVVGTICTWTNARKTFVDGWDRELKYRSYPPYQSYKLYSMGPDGEDNDGEGDDIDASSISGL
ncbi:hypothetical protein ACFLQU_01980 [Verrucomicrobiota bacterium]